MYLIINSDDSAVASTALMNQAIENYFVNYNHQGDRGVISYVSNPALIVGRDENIWDSVNVPLLNQYNIELVRKPMDSEILYDDGGTLKIKQIIQQDDGNFENYEFYAKPIITALEKSGVTAKLKDKTNMIVVDNQPFARINMNQKGNVYTVDIDIMFKVDQVIANKVILEPSFDQFANLHDYLPSKFSIWDLQTAILSEMFGVSSSDDIQTYTLTTDDKDQIEHQLADQFGLDAWNYGHNNGYGQYAEENYSAGKIGINYTIDGNTFTAFKFVPFFKVEGGNYEDIENALVGSETTDEAINQAVDKGHLKTLEKQALDNIIIHNIQK